MKCTVQHKSARLHFFTIIHIYITQAHSPHRTQKEEVRRRGTVYSSIKLDEQEFLGKRKVFLKAKIADINHNFTQSAKIGLSSYSIYSYSTDS